MPLSPAKVPITIQGLDTKTDSRQQKPGEMTVLENCRFDNYPMVRKRYGFERLGTLDRGVGELLATYQGEILSGDGRKLYTYSPLAGFLSRGVYETVGVETLSVAKSVSQHSEPDFAFHARSGFAIFTWTDAVAGASYKIVDTANGNVVLVSRSLGAGTALGKPLALSDSFMFAYQEASSRKLWVVKIPVLTPASPAAPILVATNLASSNTCFDAVVVGDVAYYVYVDQTAYLSVGWVTKALETNVATMVSVGASDALGVVSDGTQLWVGYHPTAGTATYFAVVLAGSSPTMVKNPTILDSDPSLGAAHYAIQGITGIAISGSVSFFTSVHTWVTSSSENSWMIRVAKASLGMVPVTGVYTWQNGVAIASAPVYADGRVLMLAKYVSAIDPTYFLLSTTGGFSAPIGKVAPGTGSPTAPSLNRIPTMAWVSGTALMVPHLLVERVVASSGVLFTQDGIQASTFDWGIPLNYVEAADNLLLSGAMVSMYDGQQVCEHGFHYYPESVTTALGPAGAGIAAGDYYVCATYEWMDAQGIIHESAPSPVSKVTVPTGGVQYLTHTVPTLKLTSKSTPISINVYRTALAIRGVPFLVTGPANQLLNDGTLNAVSIQDAIADASLVGNNQLVANPLNSASEVPAIPAPATNFMARYRNRVVFIPAETPGQWMFSKALDSGVPVEFNPYYLFQPADLDGAPIVGLAGLDDKLILLKGQQLYFTAGDGPAANATGSDYGTPQRIPTDSGCSEPRSIVVSPAGLFYKSKKGLQMLGRNLTVHYVGKDIEGYNSYSITSARIVQNARRLVFTLDSGVALTLDYEFGFWSTWTNLAAADGCVYLGRYCYLSPTGQLQRETPNEYADADGHTIAQRIQFGWFNFAGQSGAQRVWRFLFRGDYRGPHQLAISVGYDSSPALQQNEMIDAEQILGPGVSVAGEGTAGADSPGGGDYQQYEWQVKIARQRSTAIQVSIREIPGTPANEGLSFSSFAFLVGVESGLHKIPTTRSPNTMDAGTLRGGASTTKGSTP